MSTTCTLPKAVKIDPDASFIKEIEDRVKNTISKHKLLEGRKKIVVAASGGKDSTVALFLLKKFGYDISAITIDTQIGCYTTENRQILEKFCAEHKIPLKIVDYKEEFGMSVCYMRDAIRDKGIRLHSCTICGVPRRYLLNKYTREMKADVIVTGHNLDDECQVILINLFRNTLFLAARAGPVTGLMKDKRFVPRAKPLYFVTNAEIVKYSQMMGFPVHYGNCPCSLDAYRQPIKEWLRDFEKENPLGKRRLAEWFLKLLPRLKKQFLNQVGLDTCTQCGEPSVGKLCKTCQLMKMM